MLMRVAGPKKNYTYALWGMASLFILANTISFLYILLRCTPISFAWNTTTPGGSCLPSRDLADVYYADTAVNILTDWFCALMQVPFLFPTLPTKPHHQLTPFCFVSFQSPPPPLHPPTEPQRQTLRRLPPLARNPRISLRLHPTQIYRQSQQLRRLSLQCRRRHDLGLRRKRRGIYRRMCFHFTALVSWDVFSRRE